MKNCSIFLSRFLRSESGLSVRCLALIGLSVSVAAALQLTAVGQSVCLPAPRLLTAMPMGGAVATQFEITITGEHLDEAGEIYFSTPAITGVPKLDASGKPAPNQYVVTIAADCPTGLYEARVMTRLGISSSRIFSVGQLPEVLQKSPNTSLATAMELTPNSVCNSAMTVKSVDHYSFVARGGQRYVVDCAARRIDSKLDAVLVIADANGRDLLVDRRGGMLDFVAPADGRYVVKVHELTYKGGPEYFYRLTLQELPTDAPLPQFASTKSVSSFSWPPSGLPEHAALAEVEPNNATAQQVTLPCDISGGFFPAADVDTYEFIAKKGDVWWVEVASERLGLPTDPSVLVQHVQGEGVDQKITDVVELTDIPSPIRPSSNGYAYDGPPYDGGSSDILGKLEIKEDGLHRLQITDLFGGTRNDPRNTYRLIIRQAAPDFAVVSWALHMELRNGDRNALSKPIALRGGATMAMEVVAIRRDGFDGEIDLVMEGLPDGVTAQGLKIPAGKSRGIMLLTAEQHAPRGMQNVQFYGKAEIGGTIAKRPCRVAAMVWPVPDAWSEIPSPRLVTDVPVSVISSESAPLSMAASEKKVWEVSADGKLTIPYIHTRNTEFSGSIIQLKALGAGFEHMPPVDVVLTGDSSEMVLDLATLKTPPGEYVVAFYGGAVAKYRHRLHELTAAEEWRRIAAETAAAIDADVQKLVAVAAAAPVETKADADKAVADILLRQQAAAADLAAADAKVKAATDQAAPRDTVDILITEPIVIRVNPAEAK